MRGAVGVLGFALFTLCAAPAVAQTCEGSATSMTTETRHFKCSAPKGALAWTLNIICMDRCGQPWFTPEAERGVVDGSCSSSGTFCTPPFIRKDYNQGLYAETSAHNTQYHFAEGCQNRDQVVTFGSCPCAPVCGEQDPIDPNIQGCAPECGSPIVIDLDRGGFRFSDTAGGVFFDLDGDGVVERIAWAAEDSGDAWLALDRNGNGTIDNGTELFGNFTPLPPCEEPHGYHALAVYDAKGHGGDGDGAITAADAVFSALRLWIDSDRDGVSQPDELFSLESFGIRLIDLDYVTAERRDPHGNRLRYKSLVRLAKGTTQSVDVFLLQE
jgi:hypothetical protein